MEQNNYRGNEYRNNAQNNAQPTVKVETETKANVITKATDFIGKHKEAAIVAGVLTAGYLLRKPIAKAATWAWKNTLGRVFGKKTQTAPAPAEEAKVEAPAK